MKPIDKGYNLLALFTLNLLITSDVFPVIVGSNSTMSREFFSSFPAADNNNEIRGFAVMEAGFSLEDSTTTCSYNAIFPVSTRMDLNGGSLYLQRDLILSNNTTFTSMGNINGNYYNLRLPYNMSTLGSASTSIFTFQDLYLTMNSRLTLDSKLKFKGLCTLDGKGNALDLSGSAKLIVDAGSTLVIKDALLFGVADGKIYCEDSLSTVSFDNVVWVQDANYSFTQGHFDVVGDLLILAEDLIFAYQSDQASSIQSNATMKFDYGMTFSYDPPTSSRNLIQMIDKTAKLHLCETTLYATTTGLQLTKGTLKIEGECYISGDATVEAEGFEFGDGLVAANDLDIEYLAESSLTVSSGFLVYNNVDPS